MADASITCAAIPQDAGPNSQPPNHQRPIGLQLLVPTPRTTVALVRVPQHPPCRSQADGGRAACAGAELLLLLLGALTSLRCRQHACGPPLVPPSPPAAPAAQQWGLALAAEHAVRHGGCSSSKCGGRARTTGTAREKWTTIRKETKNMQRTSLFDKGIRRDTE